MNYQENGDSVKSLEGKRIIVAGGGGAQGRVGAKLFAEHGARVIIADASLEAAQAAADEITAADCGGDRLCGGCRRPRILAPTCRPGEIVVFRPGRHG